MVQTLLRSASSDRHVKSSVFIEHRRMRLAVSWLDDSYCQVSLNASARVQHARVNDGSGSLVHVRTKDPIGRLYRVWAL